MTEMTSLNSLQIAVFEDQKSFLAILRKFLAHMGDVRPAVDLTDLRDSADTSQWRSSVNECSMALVDLELGGSLGQSPGDYDGLDVILPGLRRVAPWLPAVLMSVYFVHSHLDLLKVAEGDFDAVLPKDVFKSCAPEEWRNFCEAVAINRIAATTARPVQVVRECYESVVTIEAGRGVDLLMIDLGESAVRDVIRLAGLGRRIVLDLVSPGFSGLSVLKATVSDGERDARWLLKVGRRLDKLVVECDAYGEMLMDGYARRISAPLLYRVPIVWAGCGLIAYEFEEDSEPLRDYLTKETLPRAIEIIAQMLKRFWNPLTEVQIIPRAAIDFEALRVWGEGSTDDSVMRKFSSIVSGTADNPLLDRSVAMLVGRQHGDLHGLNVLITGGSAMMIDFAHYRRRDRRGIPFLDVVKLAFDLWAFGDTDWGAVDLISCDAFWVGPIANLLGITGLNMTGSSAGDVVRFARLACIAEGARYLGYADVPDEKKKELRTALIIQLAQLQEEDNEPLANPLW